MAMKFLASQTNLLYSSSSYLSKSRAGVLSCIQPWPLRPSNPARRSYSSKRVIGRVVSSFADPLFSSSSSSSAFVHQLISHVPSSSFFLLADSAGYSLASYYTSLGLFVISVPGLWSLIKRSVKSKIVQKTYIVGEGGEGKKLPNQVAGEILSFFARNNFEVLDRGETITYVRKRTLNPPHLSWVEDSEVGTFPHLTNK